ncbi:MAG: hypothetical protein MZV70_33575 [Desulfobacterales bacterium]|nr:hypothetical protein [Desulfobacterales bacterium]
MNTEFPRLPPPRLQLVPFEGCGYHPGVKKPIAHGGCRDSIDESNEDAVRLVGEVANPYETLGAHHESPLNDIFKLPDVPGRSCAMKSEKGFL